MQTLKLIGSRLTLAALCLSVTACGHVSPLCKPADPVPVPPLPQQALQTASPTFSANAQTDMQAWRLKLTEPSSPASPASGPMSR